MAINKSKLLSHLYLYPEIDFRKSLEGPNLFSSEIFFFYKCLCNSVVISSKSFELISLNIMKSSLIFYLVNVTFVLVYCDLSKVFYINNGEKNVCSREFINLSIYAQLHRA